MNASPFQAGSLLIYFMPNYANAPTMYTMHTRSLISKSQLPGVRMHTCHNEAIIRVPYVAPDTHYDLADTTNAFDWGRLNIDVLTPLRVGATGSQNVEITTFLSFEDIELEGPIFPQSSVKVSKVAKPRTKVKAKKKVNITEEEAVNIETPGPLEQTFTGLVGLATKAQDVPVLSAIAKPAGWFFNLGKSVASYFGWSKPLDETTMMRVGQSYHHFMYNSEGKDMSHPLSLTVQNKVQILDNIPGHNMDEMSIDFIKSQWAYYGTYNITTGSDDNVGYIDLCPYVMAGTTTLTQKGTPFNVNIPTPVSFLQSFFRYYRGSLRLKFRIIKTDFHAGSLAIAYLPYYPGVSHTTLTVDKLARLHAEIIDIQNVDEITLEFPYADPSPYKSYDAPYGRVYLYWVNQLKCPDSVAQSIDIVVEVAGAPDLEFSVPDFACPSPIYPQSGIGVESCEQVEKTIGNATSGPSNPSIASVCIGEKIMSVLQFMKCYKRILLSNNSAFTSTPASTTTGRFNAFDIGGLTTVASGSAATSPYLAGPYGDYFNIFSVCYAYRRGSVRVRFNSPPTNANFEVNLLSEPSAYANSASGPASANMYAGGITKATYSSTALYLEKTLCHYIGNTGGWSAQIPFYSKKPLVLNIQHYEDPVAGVTNYPQNTITKNQIAWGTDNVDAPTDIGKLYRSVGDDFQLAYWIGVPIIKQF